MKKYVFLYLFSETLPYRGEMRLCVIYPIPLSMVETNGINARFLAKGGGGRGQGSVTEQFRLG